MNYCYYIFGLRLPFGLRFDLQSHPPNRLIKFLFVGSRTLLHHFLHPYRYCCLLYTSPFVSVRKVQIVMDGITIGIVTYLKSCTLFAPSICAASISSPEMCIRDSPNAMNLLCSRSLNYIFCSSAFSFNCNHTLFSHGFK